MTTIREHILDRAKECVLRDRNLDYDEPEKNFEDIADFWNTYLQGKQVIEPHDTAIMAILIKVARIRKSPKVEDHWVDLAGYAACGAECIVASEDRCEKVTIMPDSTMYSHGGALNSRCLCGQCCDSGVETVVKESWKEILGRQSEIGHG